MAGFEELTIVLPDGYEAYARYWPAKRLRGSVLYLHGIQSHCGWYEASARRLQQAGFAVLQPDRRGSGRNRQDRGHAESQEQLIEDGQACAARLLEIAGLKRFHLLGVSWGGKLACAIAAANADALQSLSLVCPGLFPIINVTKSEKFKIGLSMLGHPERHFDIPLNDPGLFTSQPRWLEFLRTDALTLQQVTASFFLATRRMDVVLRELPKRKPLPLHLMVAGDDEIVDADKTVEFVRALNWPGTRITHYPDVRHTLEFEPVREEYRSDLVEWLESVS